jgi:hypothetical protein
MHKLLCRTINLDEIAAASAIFDKSGNDALSAKELKKIKSNSADDDSSDSNAAADDGDGDGLAAADGKGTEPILRLKMEHGRGGCLDVESNILKDEDDVKTVLGQQCHLNVAALHRSLTLEKM